MHAVAPATNGHDLLAHTHRGRNRSASEAFAPVERDAQGVAEVPRAASYTYFPRVKDLLDEPSILELKGTISEDELKAAAANGEGASYPSSGGSSPDPEEVPQAEQPLQMKPTIARRSSRFLPFSNKSRDSSLDRTGNSTRKQAGSPNSMSPSRPLTRLRRKSWISSQSRSSSPTKDSGSPVKGEEPRKNSMHAEGSKRKSLSSALSILEEPRSRQATESSPATTSKSRVLTKKTKRPLSGIFSSSNAQQATSASTSNIPSVPPMPKSFSTDRLPSFSQTPTSPNHIPPLPRNLSSDKLKGAKTEPRKKDELWAVFRTLEGDLRKFQAKSIALKANVVRTALLPFLRSYASHPSNHKLRPEDLDRRANILNGWWTGLLELLAGRNNQSISGTDRPAILEGIAAVMERPEWRMSPSPFCALADRAETASTTTAKSAGSTSSGSSDFLAESVYHNVRNIFTQNLLSQIAFVVDKMSLRNAAASLVTFCGKTCAYAFCFCPGVADVLVRLWNPSLDTMRRVLEESGISRQDRLDLVSDRIASSFPPLLHSLKFQSLTKAIRYLRRPASLPLGTANLDWYGAWVKRWSGAESDLFYVFVKHYHILVTDFLPVEPSAAERVCVPGLVMVHAQILTNLDATINRHATHQQPDDSAAGAASVTFDDVLSDLDTSVSTLPIPPANATRQMAENRLIMLIRDFLSERNAHLHTARRIFAESFGHLLKATARKVSVYDNNACYTLCDFLEEAFVILVRYEQLDVGRHSVLDWPFWLSVCRQMTASQNTATEIKLFAFLYSTWPTLVSDEQRKAMLCSDFLLEPEFFESRFNHWCPMVRSYFMRLLCWRVARFDGDETAGELSIMKSLSDRLRTVWSHYLWLREEAEIKSTLPPSTAPCNPAPGRRFLIIRNDNPIVTSSGPFISFDGVVQSPVSRRLSSMNNTIPEADARPVSAQSADSQDFGEEETSKGRWSILRNFISAPKQSSKSRSPGPTNKENKAANNSSTSSADTSTRGKSTSPDRTPSPASHRSFSFRFSLEWVDKRFHNFQNMRLGPPRLPLPAQVLLQTKGINIGGIMSSRPTGPAAMSSRYAGRALAEWTLISHECQNFFERRKNEGVPSNRLVETPTLAVEAFRRPG
ncbi:DUF1765-domain-containing protein [Lindgomyces ingoldianus]|uniref:DUF1765-domain-containing protein n=1 Tax=Lindgomyces ingoldianus TaxID=673940 RepID=A0ACB6R4V7_9PLEO|nr:DUF1765-domain-containing protein [Lindgomyces ingoldianus]KAF2473345.1 DUF1765-domain-containing protein [Lindgomyces ingoldianus]